jgi:hypothetical protein
MAVNSNPGEGILQIKFQTGLDDDGKPVIRTKSFTGVKPTATDEDVYTVAQRLIGLQKHTVVSVNRINPVELTESI